MQQMILLCHTEPLLLRLLHCAKTLLLQRSALRLNSAPATECTALKPTHSCNCCPAPFPQLLLASWLYKDFPQDLDLYVNLGGAFVVRTWGLLCGPPPFSSVKPLGSTVRPHAVPQ